MNRFQRGVTTVEFAIIGLLLFVVIFGVIEFGRALFVMNTLTEATRRGARMAAVCPVGDPKPASVAVFDNGSGNSAIVSGLTSANIMVSYLDASGTPVASPTTPAGFGSIRYVRVSIVGFTLSLIIPTIMPSIPMNGFSTTLPRESLGIPRVGVVTPC
jgi:Flp pilus assembly protein TadG